jgi:hypothetical protein
VASRRHQSGRAKNQQCLAHRGPPSRGSSRPRVPRSLASASIPAPRVPVAEPRIKRVSRPSPLVGEGGAAERSSGVCRVRGLKIRRAVSTLTLSAM